MIKIEILKTVGSFKAGQIVKVETDDNDVPSTRFWRRRLKDNDGFCKVLEAPAPKKFRSPPKDQTEE